MTREIDTKDWNERNLYAVKVKEFNDKVEASGEENDYSSIYEIHDMIDDSGAPEELSRLCFTVAKYKGHREWHVFYASGKMHVSFGDNLDDAVRLAIKDAWIYA